MIDQNKAFVIAKSLIPDIELRGFRISDKLSSNSKLKDLPKDCWYVSYSHVPISSLSCSNTKTIFLCISKVSGEVLYHNYLTLTQ